MNIECRICLAECSKLNEISQSDDILHKISICFGQDIIVDNLPLGVCKLCTYKVEDIYTFRNLFISNQSILLERLKTSGYLKKCDADLETKLENKENEALHKNVLVKLEQNDPIEVVKEYELYKLDNFNSNAEDASFSLLIEQTKEVLHEGEKGLKLDVTSPGEVENLDKNIYRCLTCFKVVSAQNELIKHYNEEHADKLRKRKILDSQISKYEIIKSNGCLIYKCEKCDKTFDSKRKINRHKLTHDQDRPFLCKLCGRTYKTVWEILRHERAHSDVKTPCKYRCGFSTAYLGALKEHERRHSADHTFRYKCEKCGKGFQVSTLYEQHQNIHTGQRPFVCEICGVAFHMDRYLRAHVANVHPQSSSHKRYLCVHCSKPLDSKNALTLHLKEHGVTTKFLCDYCGKELSDVKQLRFHKRMHVSARPYRCSTCGKTFKRRFDLTVHARTHSGEREHACARCGRAYAQRSTLLRHLKRFHDGHLTDQEDTARNKT